MSLLSFYSPIGLLFFLGALLLSVLLYIKNFREKIVAAANLCWIMVFLVWLAFIIHILGNGLDDPADLTKTVGASILIHFYAGVWAIVARVWARVVEMMGNKRLKVSLRAEIVER
jgi:uncharacterized membrane protein